MKSCENNFMVVTVKELNPPIDQFSPCLMHVFCVGVQSLAFCRVSPFHDIFKKSFPCPDCVICVFDKIGHIMKYRWHLLYAMLCILYMIYLTIHKIVCLFLTPLSFWTWFFHVFVIWIQEHFSKMLVSFLQIIIVFNFFNSILRYE